jgi:hypothetical protein
VKSDYEAARLGLAGTSWAASLAALPTRELAHPWPFPTSVVDGRLVRNVAPEPAPKKTRPVKGPGSPRVIRCSWGDPPPSGSVLKTSTGRRYLVALVRGRTLHTILLAADEGLHRPHVDWVWDKKGTTKAALPLEVVA